MREIRDLMNIRLFDQIRSALLSRVLSTYLYKR